jgi:hypothetical protein
MDKLFRGKNISGYKFCIVYKRIFKIIKNMLKKIYFNRKNSKVTQ